MNTTPNYYKAEWIGVTNEQHTVDLCVYGGTSAGVIAAVTGAEHGMSVLLLNPGIKIGGMTTGGLGETDHGAQEVIGGRARRFYEDLGKAYDQKEAWQFEPHVAEDLFLRYLENARVPVRDRQFLQSTEVNDGRISRITMLGGLTVSAKMFIDATYEGDLMAQAGVSYALGRESNQVYNETANGVQTEKKHQFTEPVSPYVVPGDPSSGTLPFVNERKHSPFGSGDRRIQAYNFRVCMTNDSKLKIPWEKPEGFNDLDYELLRRWLNSEKDVFNELLTSGADAEQTPIAKFDPIRRLRNGCIKTDTNNHGAVSSDYIGANYAWPESSYSEREIIFQKHVRYQKGLYWVMANDERIPERYRAIYGKFGLASDEFEDTGHWPHQLYVREARRMVGDYVMTEHDVSLRQKPDDPVGMGTYQMDSHNCQRCVKDGSVINEGDVQFPGAGPYGISYRCIIPKKGECENLLVPVCASTSHIAYGSLRMEPVFMILAESAAQAARIALEEGCSTQDVAYERLSERLLEAGQVLHFER